MENDANSKENRKRVILVTITVKGGAKVEPKKGYFGAWRRPVGAIIVSDLVRPKFARFDGKQGPRLHPVLCDCP